MEKKKKGVILSQVLIIKRNGKDRVKNAKKMEPVNNPYTYTYSTYTRIYTHHIYFIPQVLCMNITATFPIIYFWLLEGKKGIKVFDTTVEHEG